MRPLWVTHPRYLVRHSDGRYEWARIFDYDHPVPEGDELRAARCVAPSPFTGESDRVFYFGGYDAGGRLRKHNTAWIYRGEMPAISLPGRL